MKIFMNCILKPTGGSLSKRSRFSSFLSYIPNLNCIDLLTTNAAPLANAEAGYVPIPRLPLRGYRILDQLQAEIAADEVVMRNKAMKDLKRAFYEETLRKGFFDSQFTIYN